jgi:DNA-directed RNA polymerase subunit RPC12/RpoP
MTSFIEKQIDNYNKFFGIKKGDYGKSIYTCKTCNIKFEEKHSLYETVKVKCPSCSTVYSMKGLYS